MSPSTSRTIPTAIPAAPPTEEYDEDYQINRTLQFVRLVVAIQAALLPVRYAIGGHLALRLYDPLWDMGLPSETSRATKPSIVCPLATRDVLPSWAAASHKAFLFNPKQPDCLGVRVGERYVAVAIQWVDDCEFDRPGLLYEIDQTHTIYNFVNDNNDAYSIQLDMAPPILSLKSLLQQIAVAYIETKSGSSSTVASKSEQSSLGYQVNACLRLLILQMAPDNQFLRPYEIPAIHDPTFLGLYYTNFGTRVRIAVSTPLVRELDGCRGLGVLGIVFLIDA
ncbi:hypothetical protein SCUCBS95973_003935 [Sporothrix curviconia]|uniref:Uncharacterized protein n=1 Tax=Sporothrix curviconia TaxID=1260050 RepID=A0ABP0BJH6_9PEZI